MWVFFFTLQLVNAGRLQRSETQWPPWFAALAEKCLILLAGARASRFQRVSCYVSAPLAVLRRFSNNARAAKNYRFRGGSENRRGSPGGGGLGGAPTTLRIVSDVLRAFLLIRAFPHNFFGENASSEKREPRREFFH